jgi:hypothetical protein
MVVEVAILDTDTSVGDAGEILAKGVPVVGQARRRVLGCLFDIVPLEDWNA